MADRFEELRIFVTIVDQQTISAAADTLNVAPSAVSRRLKDLETRLGTQLLHRTTRKMHLTDAGSEFLLRARSVLSDLDEAEKLASDDTRTLSGRLRLSVPQTYGNNIIMPIISRFLLENPDMTADLELSDRRVDLMEERFDAVIRIGNLENSSFKARKLGTTKFVTVASPQLVQTHGPFESIDDINDVPAIEFAFRLSTSTSWEAKQEGKVVRARPKITLSANDGEAMVTAASAGLGIARLPCFIAEKALNKGLLVEVLPNLDWGGTAIHIIYPHSERMPRRLRALIDYLVANINR